VGVCDLGVSRGETRTRSLPSCRWEEERSLLSKFLGDGGREDREEVDSGLVVKEDEEEGSFG
jgi:hypothetical protein